MTFDCTTINQEAEAPKIADAFPELRCSFGDRSLVPDVAIFQWNRIPFTEDGQVPDNFALPPDWVIEILSPEQKANKVIGNILHCLAHGCQLGWFVDLDDFSILVFLPEQLPILMQGQTSLPVKSGIFCQMLRPYTIHYFYPLFTIHYPLILHPKNN